MSRAVSSTLPLSTSNRSCYSRNGTLIIDIAYQPCSPSGESFCCGTNHDGAGHVGVANDVCETNGLCQNYEGFDGTNEGVKMWWRQGCTDPTWSSPNCLANVCDSEEFEDDNAPVYSCGNGNWVCGQKEYCSTSSRVFTLAATVGREAVASTRVSASASASSAATALDSTVATATTSITLVSTRDAFSATANPSSSEPTGSSLATTAANPTVLSIGAKAGIGVGIAVFALLLGIILFLLHKIKKNKKRQEAYAKAELPGQDEHGEGKKPQTIVYARENSSSPVEMPAYVETAQELSTQRDRMELATTEKAHEMGQERVMFEMNASPSVGRPVGRLQNQV